MIHLAHSRVCHLPKGISIGSSVFARHTGTLDSQARTQTRWRHDVRNRPLSMLYMWCWLKKTTDCFWRQQAPTRATMPMGPTQYFCRQPSETTNVFSTPPTATTIAVAWRSACRPDVRPRAVFPRIPETARLIAKNNHAIEWTMRSRRVCRVNN